MVDMLSRSGRLHQCRTVRDGDRRAAGRGLGDRHAETFIKRAISHHRAGTVKAVQLVAGQVAERANLAVGEKPACRRSQALSPQPGGPTSTSGLALREASGRAANASTKVARFLRGSRVPTVRMYRPCVRPCRPRTALGSGRVESDPSTIG